MGFLKQVALYLLFIVPTILYGQDNIDSLKQIAYSSNSDTAKSRIFYEVAETYFNQEKDSSFKYALLAASIAKKSDHELLLMHSTFLIGKIKYHIYDYDSSLFYLNSVEEIIKEKQDSALLNSFFAYKGVAIRGQGNLKEAKIWLFKSFRVAHNMGDTFAAANRLNILGNICSHIGENDSAIFYLYTAQKLFDIIGDTAMYAATLINMCSIYLEMKELDKAEEYALKSIHLNKKSNHLEFLSLGYTRMGWIYSLRKNFQLAKIYYDSSLAIVSQLPPSIELANLHMNIGVIYVDQEKWEAALSEYFMARQIFYEINDIKGQLEILLNIGVIYERRGQFKKSQQMYDTALVIAEKYGFNEAIVSLYFNKYRGYELTGDYRKAFDYQTLYHTAKDSIYSLEKTKYIKDLEFKYEQEKKDAHILKLKHEALVKDARLNTYYYRYVVGFIVFIAIVIVLLLLVYFQRQKAKKNKIIHDKEVMALLEKEKTAAARALVEGQEEERKRVAMELHDGLGVLLSNVKMQFTNFIARSDQNSAVLHKAAIVLDRASVDVRRISHNMMPSVLTKFGLNISLEELLDEINEMKNMSASIKLQGDDKKLSENTQIMIYRIIQELVNNTIKHANANKISLILDYSLKELKIWYSDNGIGFSPGTITGTLGLKSIASRVRFLNGELTNESKPGKGVSYIISIPYFENE